MKRLITVLAITIMLTGCGTIPTVTEQALITQAAQLGTEQALVTYPQYIADFTAGAQVLNNISNSTNVITISSVEEALATGGVTNSVVASGIADAITDADGWIAANQTNSSAVQDVCGWVATGINEGLEVTVTK